MKWLTAPVGFTDSQLAMLTYAAAVLAPEQRDAFLRAVAAGSGPEPDDDDVRRALEEAR